jgi:hypothetical protein
MLPSGNKLRVMSNAFSSRSKGLQKEDRGAWTGSPAPLGVGWWVGRGNTTYVGCHGKMTGDWRKRDVGGCRDDWCDTQPLAFCLTCRTLYPPFLISLLHYLYGTHRKALVMTLWQSLSFPLGAQGSAARCLNGARSSGKEAGRKNRY